MKRLFLMKNTAFNMIEVSDHINALQKLGRTLDVGNMGRGILKMPVGEDPSKLPYAEGLSNFERTLAHEINFKAEHMPGNLKVRRLMGHCAAGARVCYGESLFLTWSPNEQHSA